MSFIANWNVYAGEVPSAAKWNQIGESLDYLYASILPIGGIILWSGSVASIPANFALCDGASGTPNLKNRFIVGAGDSYAVGATGGADTVTLNTSQMPSHSHGGVTGNSGNLFSTSTGDTEGNTYAKGIQNGDNVSGKANHAHTISAEGGGGSHENRPPYYALAYIMRVS